MSEKRYPTRMHEVLGVEPNEEFYINGEFGIFFLTKEGYLSSDNAGRNSNWIVHAINHGITRRPRLTEEQVYALEALYKVFGMRFVAYDKENGVGVAFQKSPMLLNEKWSGGAWRMHLHNASALLSLCENYASAPLDIVQVLRQNGVEVEG